MAILLRLLRNLLVNFFLALLWPLRRLRRRAPVFVRLELRGHVPPRPGGSRLPFFLRRFARPVALDEETVGRVVDAACGDRHALGVLLVLRDLRAGFGQLAALRRRLDALRDHGKVWAVYLSEGRTGAYYLASGASKLFLAPGGALDLTGLAAEVRFYKGLLDKLPARAEVLARGRYKNAFDPFARDGMSEAHREATDALLDDLAAELEGGIARGRGLDRASVRRTIDLGPYGAERALESGLVDALAYEDELEERLGEDGKKATFVEPRAYLASRKAFDWRPLRRPRCVAFVPLRGTIHGGESKGGKDAGAETVVASLEAARKDRRARAVLLHVDSRGGSSLASDLIWRAARRVAAEKPVVAYLADYAASGGYYVACAAREIVASPATVTGSIGVIAAKVDASGLFARLGIRVETLRRGARADLYTTSRGLTEEERARLAADIDAIYEQFLQRVAEGRKKSRDEIHAVAEGRVWSGVRAKELGLVDLIGGPSEAARRAASLAGFSEDADFPLVSYAKAPRPNLGLLALLGLRGESRGDAAAGLANPEILASLANLAELANPANPANPAVAAGLAILAELGGLDAAALGALAEGRPLALSPLVVRID